MYRVWTEMSIQNWFVTGWNEDIYQLIDEVSSRDHWEKDGKAERWDAYMNGNSSVLFEYINIHQQWKPIYSSIIFIGNWLKIENFIRMHIPSSLLKHYTVLRLLLLSSIIFFKRNIEAKCTAKFFQYLSLCTSIRNYLSS